MITQGTPISSSTAALPLQEGGCAAPRVLEPLTGAAPLAALDRRQSLARRLRYRWLVCQRGSRAGRGPRRTEEVTHGCLRHAYPRRSRGPAYAALARGAREPRDGGDPERMPAGE